jgi:hypothetical protein
MKVTVTTLVGFDHFSSFSVVQQNIPEGYYPLEGDLAGIEGSSFHHPVVLCSSEATSAWV